MKISSTARKKALIAYITFIGMLIAMSMNSDKKELFATRHIQNMFGLTILWICSQIITVYVNIYLGDTLWLLSFVLLIINCSRAYQEKLPNIPYLSKLFSQWFTFLD